MIPFDDRGLTLGDGLFETLLASDGELVLFDAHLKRMTRGCKVLGLPAPDAAEARALCEAALHLPSPARGEGRRFAVRLTLTAGSGGRGLDRPDDLYSRLFATAAPAPRPEGPVALTTVTVRRNEGSPASRLKTLAYLDQILARREAGAGEALMLNNRGEVSCAAAANVFWLSEGVLRTPALSCGVLEGVMRTQAMAAARRLGIPVQEVAAPRAVLDQAQAVFLTNSLIGLRRVDRLDGVAVGDAPQVSALAQVLEAIS